MLKHPVHRLGIGLLIVIISACQSSPATQPSPAASSSVVQEQLLTGIQTHTASAEPNRVQTDSSLPQLMQLPASSIEQINPNLHGLLANPTSLPARSSQTINETTLAEIELLQTIGVGQLQSGDFATNGQFVAVVTSLGFGVYKLPALQQRFFVRSEHPITAIRVSPDNATIEALIETKSDPAVADSWSIERYKATTGVLIERVPTADTEQTWNTQPINNQPPTLHISSPDGQIEAQLTLTESHPNNKWLKLIRIAQKELIYNGTANQVRFSADSRQALLIDQHVLRVVNLSDGGSQALEFPIYQRVTFSPNGRLLALNNGQEILNLEQTRIAYSLSSQQYSADLPVRPDFSSDSSQINLGVSQWDLKAMQALWQQEPSRVKDRGNDFFITNADQQLVVEVNKLDQVEVYISQAGSSLDFSLLVLPQLADLAISERHNELIVVTEQGDLNVIEPTTGTTVQNLKLNQPVIALAIGPYERWIAVATQPKTANGVCAVLIEYQSLQRSREIQCHSSNQTFNKTPWYPAIQFSPDGQLLLLQSAAFAKQATEPSIIIYLVADGQALFSAPNAIISPDQGLIASIDRGQLQLWGICK